jgi:hypothetical protein
MFRKYIFVLLSLSIVLSSCGKSKDLVREVTELKECIAELEKANKKFLYQRDKKKKEDIDAAWKKIWMSCVNTFVKIGLFYFTPSKVKFGDDGNFVNRPLGYTLLFLNVANVILGCVDMVFAFNDYSQKCRIS